MLKYQKISNGDRVIIEKLRNGVYSIAAQEYMPYHPITQEVREDGWRDTQVRYSGTLEGAKREFEAMVRNEQRYAEMQRRYRYA